MNKSFQQAMYGLLLRLNAISIPYAQTAATTPSYLIDSEVVHDDKDGENSSSYPVSKLKT